MAVTVAMTVPGATASDTELIVIVLTSKEGAYRLRLTFTRITVEAESETSHDA